MDIIAGLFFCSIISRVGWYCNTLYFTTNLGLGLAVNLRGYRHQNKLSWDTANRSTGFYLTRYTGDFSPTDCTLMMLISSQMILSSQLFSDSQ